MIEIKFVEIDAESTAQQTISLYKILKSEESSLRQRLAQRLRRARKRINNKIKKSADLRPEKTIKNLDAYFLLKTRTGSNKS